MTTLNDLFDNEVQNIHIRDHANWFHVLVHDKDTMASRLGEQTQDMHRSFMVDVSHRWQASWIPDLFLFKGRIILPCICKKRENVHAHMRTCLIAHGPELDVTGTGCYFQPNAHLHLMPQQNLSPVRQQQRYEDREKNLRHILRSAINDRPP